MAKCNRKSQIPTTNYQLPSTNYQLPTTNYMSPNPSPKVYGVSELTDVIKGLLRPYDKIYVEGEISGWRLYASGHAYFTVKDSSAQLSCVMFASSLERCKAAARLRDGVKVCLYGRLDVYAPRGCYQMVALAAKVAGEGDLMAQFNELKDRLGKEGLFDSGRKRKLPFLPHRIAIVTSPSGAVIHDMCTVLTRRFPNVEIRLYPVKVQGPGAKEEIVSGIGFFNAPSASWKPDVLIVGRGGGSIEDLWAFNEECVVRAVAASRIPVVSAVGHETDFTLCDFAADVRAGTPSIAAELVVPVKDKLVRQIRDLSARLVRTPQYACDALSQRVDHLSDRLASALRNRAELDRNRLVSLSGRLLPTLRESLIRSESRLSHASQMLPPLMRGAMMRTERRLMQSDQRLVPLMRDAVARAELRLSSVRAKLALLDPENPLKRGYSLTLDVNGRIVRRAQELRSGDELTTRLGEGVVASVVK